MRQRERPETLGERVKWQRIVQGISQGDLADMAGVSTQFLYNIERGRQNIRSDNLIKLSRALQVSTDYLLLGEMNERDSRFLSERIERLGKHEQENLHVIIERYCDSFERSSE